MRTSLLGAAALIASFAMPLSAQLPTTAGVTPDSARTQPALVRRDLWAIAFVGAGTALAMPFDRSVNEEFRDSAPQRSTFLKDGAHLFNGIGDPGVLIASMAMWGAGHLTRKPELVRLGGHAGLAIVGSGFVTAGLKMLIGRQRPFVAVGDPFDFTFFRGSRGDQASLPSGHATAAFAFASSLATDLRIDHPNGARVAVPLLYAGAVAVGASRMYVNKHWLSDVVMGAGIGSLIGHRTVTYSRSHPKGWLGRHFNGSAIMPSATGLRASIPLR